MQLNQCLFVKLNTGLIYIDELWGGGEVLMCHWHFTRGFRFELNVIVKLYSVSLLYLLYFELTHSALRVGFWLMECTKANRICKAVNYHTGSLVPPVAASHLLSNQENRFQTNCYCLPLFMLKSLCIQKKMCVIMNKWKLYDVDLDISCTWSSELSSEQNIFLSTSIFSEIFQLQKK